MQNVPNLGQLANEDSKRDAVHIAVAPLIAGDDLLPGHHVTVQDGIAYRIYASSDKPHGVVDPFLVEPVRKGQRFWLFIYPGAVTSLRHVWTHPAFKVTVPNTKEQTS